MQEACADHPAMIKDVRDLTAAETLPQVDGCLGTRLREILAQPVGARLDLRLDRTMEYIARFADGSLVVSATNRVIYKLGSSHKMRRPRYACRTSHCFVR